MKPTTVIPALTTAAVLSLSTALYAQTTGVSHPEYLDDNINVPAQATPQPVAKPSPMVAMQTTPPAPTLQTRVQEPMSPMQAASYAPYVPLDRSTIVTDDPTSGVVMEVPSGPHELPVGTLIRAELVNQLSTKGTANESRFSARLGVDIVKHGRVLLPAGTLINGRVTLVHGGSRFSGPAAIHIQPDIVKLPNGRAYELEAEVIDLDHFKEAHVNDEGTIIGNDNRGQTATTFGATTGGGALIGAAMGGGVGAVIGAGVGAGVSTVWWLCRDRQETLPRGTAIVFTLDRSLDLEPEVR